MSFDARSLERLKQLGRQLPQPLPLPEPVAPSPPAGQRRHRVETETDPEALFRELIQVSPDGTVPPHLLDRLRHAEADQRQREQERQRQERRPQASSSGAASADSPRTARGRGDQPLRANPGRRRPGSEEEQELYSTFQQLLLEGDGDD